MLGGWRHSGDEVDSAIRAVNGKQLDNSYSEIVAPDGDVTRFTLAGIVNQECAEHKGNRITAACNSNWPVGKKPAVPKKNAAYPKPIMGLVTIAARELSSAIRSTKLCKRYESCRCNTSFRRVHHLVTWRLGSKEFSLYAGNWTSRR